MRAGECDGRVLSVARVMPLPCLGMPRLADFQVSSPTTSRRNTAKSRHQASRQGGQRPTARAARSATSCAGCLEASKSETALAALAETRMLRADLDPLRSSLRKVTTASFAWIKELSSGRAPRGHSAMRAPVAIPAQVELTITGYCDSLRA
jgi:hypothetical protein